MILILTDSNDVHADVVSMKLGDNYFRLNLDIEALKDTKLALMALNGLSPRTEKQSKIHP
jgi:hypothetical protein